MSILLKHHTRNKLWTQHVPLMFKRLIFQDILKPSQWIMWIVEVIEHLRSHHVTGFKTIMNWCYTLATTSIACYLQRSWDHFTNWGHHRNLREMCYGIVSKTGTSLHPMKFFKMFMATKWGSPLFDPFPKVWPTSLTLWTASNLNFWLGVSNRNSWSCNLPLFVHIWFVRHFWQHLATNEQ